MSESSRAEGFLAAGVALAWGGAVGFVDFTFFRSIPLMGILLHIRYLCATILLHAILSLSFGLAIWMLYRLFFVNRVRRGSDLMGPILVQIGVVVLPVIVAVLFAVLRHLPAAAPVLSPVGIATALGVLCLATLLVAIVARLVIRPLLPRSDSALRAFRALAILGLSGTLLAAAGVFVELPAGSARPGKSSRPNILLISIDSLRYDVWQEYVAKHASPVLRRFASAARTYHRAYTTGSHSLPSHASMFSGLYPPEHGASIEGRVGVGDLGSPVDPDVELLAERLSAEGYETIGIMSNAWLGPPYGLEAGFDIFVNKKRIESLQSFNPYFAIDDSLMGAYLRWADHNLHQRKHPNTRLFLGLLEQRKQSRPLFAFLHFMDMHVPNSPPARYVRRFSRGPFAALGGTHFSEMIREGRVPEAQLPQFLTDVRALNLASLNEMDEFVAPVLQETEPGGLLEDTLVILVSDHGDHLFEKMNWYAHSHVYDTVGRIPLLIRVPGAQNGSDQHDLVSLVDISATIRSYAGLEPQRGSAGLDLLTEAPQRESGRWIFLEGWDFVGKGTARAVVSNYGRKWIVGPTGSEELYDLALDPTEHQNLAGIRREAADEMRSRFQQVVARMKAVESSPVEIEDLPDDVLERLRALGYVR